MKSNDLHSILADIAEEAVPTARIDLWKDLKGRLPSSEPRIQPGDSSMKPSFARTPVIRLSLAAVAILAILAVFFVTPSGRTLAHSLFRFFNKVETVSPIFTPGETPGGRTYPPFYAQCGDYGNPTCTLQQVGGMVNFEVKGLSTLPEGMAFTGVTGGPTLVNLLYQGDQTFLSVIEVPISAADQISEIGTSARVESVMIHPQGQSGASIPAEYVKGTWAGAWFSDAYVQTLRWQDGQVIYTLQGYGTILFHGLPLERDGLVELAGSLTADKVVLQVTPVFTMQWSTPAPESSASRDFEFPLPTVTDLETLAGYKVTIPSLVPNGLSFQNASYLRSKKNACLYYHTGPDVMNNLVILENPESNLPDIMEWARQTNEQAASEGYSPLPPLKTVSQVNLNGAEGGTGTYVDGWLSYSLLCGSKNHSLYHENTLLWKRSDGRSFILSVENNPGNLLMTRMEMVRLAEDLNGASSSIPAGAADLERLPSLEAARTQWGSSFLVPVETFGRAFSFAQVKADGNSRTLTLVYYGPLQISVSINPADSLEGLYNSQPEAYRRTSVRGQAGLYGQGCFNADKQNYDWNCPYSLATLTWYENGLKYKIMSSSDHGTLSEDKLIILAESLK